MKVEMRKTEPRNKITSNNYSSNGKQTAEILLISFYAVLELFETNSGLLQNFYCLKRPLRITKRQTEVYTGCKMRMIGPKIMFARA